jgi:hypothetical protein
MKNSLSYVAIAVAAALLGACGGDRDDDGQATGRPAEGIPACAGAGSAISRPDGLPAELLPPGTVLTSDDSDSGEIEVRGYIPTTLQQAAKFFAEELPRRGYRLGEGDSEQDEAEAPFSGKGVSGKWKLNGILDCPNAVSLALRIESS